MFLFGRSKSNNSTKTPESESAPKKAPSNSEVEIEMAEHRQHGPQLRGSAAFADAASQLLTQYREERLQRLDMVDHMDADERVPHMSSADTIGTIGGTFMSQPRLGQRLTTISTRRGTVKLVKKNEFSGYVSVSDILDLATEEHEEERGMISEEHFEGHDDGARFLKAENAMNFRFQRQVRRSLLMSLGVDKDQVVAQDLFGLDVYSKSSNKDARMAFLGLIVGFGSLSLPSAIAKCGVFPGVGALLVFSLLNYFICNRIVEAPQLLEYNTENIIQTVGLILSSSTVRVVTLISVISWMTPTILYLNATRGQVTAVLDALNSTVNATWFPEEAKEPADWVLDHYQEIFTGASALVALFFTWFVMRAKTIKTVRTSAKVSWSAMLCVGLFTLAGSGWHFAKDVYVGEAEGGWTGWQSIKWYGDWVGLFKGIQGMFLAFGGIIIIPYIAAEMNSAADTGKVIRQGVLIITVYYVLIGVVGYIGWASIFEKLGPDNAPPVPWIMASITAFEDNLEPWEEAGYIALGAGCHVCLWLKAVSSLPILFWPMMREFKFLFAYYEDPATELQLPWATSREKRRRTGWRVFIIVTVLSLVTVIAIAEEDEKMGKDSVIKGFSSLLLALMDVLPTFVMSLLFPASVALFAIWRHARLMEARQARRQQKEAHRRQSCCPCILRNPDRTGAVQYAGGSYCSHVFFCLLAFTGIMFLLVVSVYNVHLVLIGVSFETWGAMLVFVTVLSIVFFVYGS